MSISPGSLVSYREREWVVLPSDNKDIILLRPIGGSAREVTGVLKPLADQMKAALPYEEIKPATFPLPDSEAVQDHTAVHLLQRAARLLLRDGAAPFRSLGHLSVSPRPYQFVPLVMALRLDTIRLLIADDVGVGKTIEGALIARELLDRGEITRLAVLCPPYLCDQWRRELTEKFNIDAAVIRSGTVARLERLSPPDTSVFENTHFIASIDLVKQPHYKQQFLHHCPSLVIVDEAHGATRPPQGRSRRAQQQRHELLKELAENDSRNLILLTATPHSGMTESFLSLLSLLKPQFGEKDLGELSDAERAELARHFVQRRRADVKQWMGVETDFPERVNAEENYKFSPPYKKFYQSVYDFAGELVEEAGDLKGWKKRMRFWSALALLKCVTSSPAAAEATLEKRLKEGKAEQTAALEVLEEATDEQIDETYSPSVSDSMETESSVDAPPSDVFDAQELDPDWDDPSRRRLREFAREARKLKGAPDTKLTKLVEVVKSLVEEGYHPIVWCRYIATSDYVAEALAKALSRPYKDLKVTAVNGTYSEDERRLKVEELEQSRRRVLVATDCLSEGVNLQKHFSAVVHYDLPWNPNRLEQREGRVDRFGQSAKKVKAVLLYGYDNPVDGALLEVLLRKAREIHKALGVYVPVPLDSETVMETVLKSLFKKAKYDGGQERLFDVDEDLSMIKGEFHESWDKVADREKESRTRFAQRAIKPEEVESELKTTDDVLGNASEVARFLQETSGRLGFGLRSLKNDVWELETKGLPATTLFSLGDVPAKWRITFKSPTPEGLAYIGRSHPLVETLSEYMLDLAFHPHGSEQPAARLGVIRTTDVGTRTTLLLLRIRYLLYERGEETPGLAEETVCWGFEGIPSQLLPIEPDKAQELLDSARPAGNVALSEKRETLDEMLKQWKLIQQALKPALEQRAKALQEAQTRVRSVLKQQRLKVELQLPPDLLGMVVLLPVPGGGKP
jgi:superfamily II DNA or RNA helicase